MKALSISLCILSLLVHITLGAFLLGDDSEYRPTRINVDSLQERPRRGRHQMERPKRRKPAPAGVGSRYLRGRPGRRQLDKSSLLTLLGDDFEPNFMTADRPKRTFISVPAHEVNVDKLSNRWSQEDLMQQLSKLNLTEELRSVDPELVPLEDKIRSWMLQRSSCPVHFSWKDLGKKFWPRWVREGVCVNREGYCSFPIGMNCVPGATTKVQLLNWQCDYDNKRRSKRNARSVIVDDSERETSVLYKKPVPMIPTKMPSKERQRSCDWIKVPFYITIDCFCTC